VQSWSTLVLAVVCCGLYPLIVFGISQLLFRDQANGSLIVSVQTGSVRGSKLLGQSFSDANIVTRDHSAAGNGYVRKQSGGSNLGPTSQKLKDAIQDRIAAYRAENGLNETEPVPADCSYRIGQRPRSRDYACVIPRSRFRAWLKLGH